MKSSPVADARAYLDPGSALWSKVAPIDIALIPTPLMMQPTPYIQKSWDGREYGKVKRLEVASVHDARHFALRASWVGVAPPGGDFPDAIAMAMPISGKPALALMGAPDAPIHYLRWQANKEALRSIVATGIGKSRPGPALDCAVRAQAHDGVWSVVMVRALGHAADTAPLQVGRKTGVGFAVWSGANDERAGIKAFSIDWTELVLSA